MRGFASIGLWRPKRDGNIGGALRAAYAFDARLVVLIGTRTLRWSRAGKIESTDTGAAAKHLPVITLDTLPDGLVFGAALVAVEVVPDGEQMPTFGQSDEHPLPHLPTGQRANRQSGIRRP